MSVPIEILWNALVGQTIRVTMRDVRTKHGVQTTVAKAPFSDLGADELEFYKMKRNGYEERFRHIESKVFHVSHSDKGLCITIQEPIDPAEPEYKYSFWVPLDTEVAVVEPRKITPAVLDGLTVYTT